MGEQEWRDDVNTSPPVFTNLAQLVGRNAASHPNGIAVVQPSRRRRSLTWAELDFLVTSVASGLAAHGLVAGHRVAVCGPNSIEFVVAYFAALRAGFVCVPVNPEASDEDVHSMLLDCGARALLSAADRQIADVRTFSLTESGLQALGADGSGRVISPADREALAVLLYTAGTSGDPKAAMLTHRALLGHLEHIEPYEIVDDHTIVLGVLPMFGVFGLNAVLGSSVMGAATLVVADASDDLMRIIVEERVTNLPVAPSTIYRLLQHDEVATSLVEVRTVVCGAVALPPALADAFTSRTGLRVDQGYGLTEASPGVTVTLGGGQPLPGRLGRPLPGVDVRVGDGRDEGEPAEIWIRGDNLFSGYWPDGSGGPDHNGWFATGDIGYLADGELVLVDRVRELITVNGFHVYPAEVEAVIRELPGIDDVAVVGKPDERSGEQVVAFAAGSGVTEQMILDHCSSSLARFKRPTEVHLLEELPRGATGKIKKGALRRLTSAAEVSP